MSGKRRSRKPVSDLRPLLSQRPEAYWIGAFFLLQELVLQLHRTRSLEEALQGVVDAASELLGVKYASVILVDLEQRKFLRSASNDPTRPPQSTWQYLRPNGLTLHVARRKEIEVIEDVRSHPLANNPILGELGIQSLMAIPIAGSEGVIGVLYAMSDVPRTFDQIDIFLARTLAAHAATAIENHRLQQQLRQMALTDPLTGLANRRAYMDRLEMELQRLTRGYTSRLGIVQMDLDYLKDVNDRFGHQTGDRYIQAFAEALRQSVRETDVAGRIGGDEFALVLLEVESVQVVLEILRRIQQAWEQLVGEALRSLASFSAGVVMIPAQGEAQTYSLDQVYARVDEALYQAKNLGRSRVVYEGESSGVLRLKEEPS